jgi:monoamine oxidase
MTNFVHDEAAASTPAGNTVAIVGGGIGGLYCARELAARGCHVELFEQSDRFGGRIETGYLEPGPDGRGTPPFPAEFGPMRFELELQPLLDGLLRKDYNLKTKPFSPPGGATPPFTFDLEADERFGDVELPALELLKLGVCRMFGYEATAGPGKKPGDPPVAVLSEGAEEWLESLGDENGGFENLRRTGRLRTGIVAYEEGFWNALRRTLSPHAVGKIEKYGAFFHLMPENVNAAEWAIFWLRIFKMKKGLTTIDADAGVSSLTEAILGDLRSKWRHLVKLRPERRVVGLQPAVGGGVEIEVVDQSDRLGRTERTTADHVVLALPKAPLKALSADFSVEVREALESINGFPMVKVFCVTTTPATWRALPKQLMAQEGSWDVETREIHYFPPEKPADYTMVLFYTDRPATSFWQRYVSPAAHDRAEYDGDPGLKEMLAALLVDLQVSWANRQTKKLGAELRRERGLETQAGDSSRDIQHILRQNQQAIVRELLRVADADPEIRRKLLELHPRFFQITGNITEAEQLLGWQRANVHSFAIRDWSRPPYGAGCHAWVPGARSWEVRELFKAFRLTGGSARNVHIVGEAYSDYHGFIEGALRSANDAMEKIAPRPPARDES